MSFVDLQKDDLWSEVDITNRTENIIRSFISRDEETILNRKIAGALLGRYQFTADELSLIQQFDAVSNEARESGRQARLDTQLLKDCLEYEKVCVKLADLDLIPLSDDPDIAAAQTAEHEALQAQKDAATPEVVGLAGQRGRIPT